VEVPAPPPFPGPLLLLLGACFIIDYLAY
jgi:hypothetical protein